MQKMLVSPSPHIHTDLTTRRLMLDVIIALIPATLVALAFYGWRELAVLAVSVIGCVLLEWAVTKYMLKRPSTIGDLSAVVTGLLLGLNLPSLTPLWVVLVGVIVAIGVAKMSFGGLGQNMFNPAIVARVFLLISFPTVMVQWATPELSSWSLADAVTGPTFLASFKEAAKAGAELPAHNMLIQSGSAGEISGIALLLGFVYLLVRRVIKPWIPLSVIGSVAVFSAALWLVNPAAYMNPVSAVFSGGVLLGAIFMATDYVTSPMTTKGGVIFGVCIGVLTVIIRNWGAYPEGVSFAILIMNAFVPLINKACKSKKFGRA